MNFIEIAVIGLAELLAIGADQLGAGQTCLIDGIGGSCFLTVQMIQIVIPFCAVLSPFISWVQLWSVK